ncbi:ervatamin-C-like isoform X2 [Triticum urartu]|uniref:Peptidase C1A papain C-terminal domain-containing protein n=2 Tax=Triticum urartu TaxID=4572 RepID=A0A8R7TDC8_TRIUA|nr:ervatamin-C-like isoform X2 [Triticum urartu]XP_048554643.1 ervatamin-C-like isoform X2 [Triticum urartu]XP_048554644.1 ervatamin-C-like isoform X2 [Triticum urartu]
MGILRPIMAAKVDGQRMSLTDTRNGGVVSETDYPYRGIRGPCKAVEAAGVTIANWAAVEPTEEAVKYAVAYQPVVASIYTNSKFRRYIKGFLEVPRNPGPVNHSVLLLGYGECPLQGECWIGMSSYRNRRRWGITWRGQYRNIFFLPRNTCHVEGALRVLTNVVLPLGGGSQSCPACFKWVGLRWTANAVGGSSHSSVSIGLCSVWNLCYLLQLARALFADL